MSEPPSVEKRRQIPPAELDRRVHLLVQRLGIRNPVTVRYVEPDPRPVAPSAKRNGHRARRNVLEALREAGTPATATLLAPRVSLTVPATRRALQALERLELVHAVGVRRGDGAVIYALTDPEPEEE